MDKPRHPLNVSGPFYVVHEECIACCVPEEIAPDLMDHVDQPYYHCYFKQQPQNEDELVRACRAVMLSCVKAVRYAGRDSKVLRRLKEMDSAASCDHPEE